MEWQPIKTAPKDIGVIIYIPDYPGEVHAAVWDTWREAWCVYSCSSIKFPFDDEYYPTHWMPLPPPPTA